MAPGCIDQAALGAGVDGLSSNPIERAVQQELKRRTAKVRVFPNDQALLRLVSAVLVEIDETWACDNKGYIKWDRPDA